MREKLLDFVLYTILVFCAIMIIFFNVYSIFLNNTNHTGISMSFLIGIYVFMMLITSMIKRISREKEKRNKPFIYIAIFSLCVIGILNIIMFERLNIMMNYDFWLKKGMPNKFIVK